MTAKSKSGFTLVELMVVIAVLGILMSIAALGLRNYILQLRLNEASVTVIQTLKRLGDLAITQSRPVRLQVTAAPELTWAGQGTGSTWEQLGTLALPEGTTLVQNPIGAITFSGRGLPQTQTTFTIRRGNLQSVVTLLPSGLVVQP
jgi:prepilin-type N-terminal cleavage/methylation domain-containing protein